MTRDIWEVLEWLARYPRPSVAFGDTSPLRGEEKADVVIAANPELLGAHARRNWLVGDAPATGDIDFERVGTKWPL